ncbi:MAG: 23S rRNA (pseudouridine(1915)-N(3))-methyltransferase RlmH [Bacteroidota bacterium]
MKIKLILTGKTVEQYVKEGVFLYEKRLKHYIPFEAVYLSDLKSTAKLPHDQIKEKEAEQQLKQINHGDFVILLDEKGKESRSVEFSSFIQQRMNSGVKTLLFVIGGPYGFDPSILKRADAMFSLSKLTFSHQIVRILFMEQLYRAFTIIKNEPYHNEG